MISASWDAFYLGMAAYVAGKSKDPSTKVGCCLVDSKHRVISLGFNGAPHGVSDHHVTRDEKLAKTIHAELNAVLFAPRDLEGATAYVTHPPCAPCAAVLVQKGVTRVVYPKPSEEFLSRWRESYCTALSIFKARGVVVDEACLRSDQDPARVRLLQGERQGLLPTSMQVLPSRSAAR